jgi:capsular exopolysaccharide synthesis family protein
VIEIRSDDEDASIEALFASGDPSEEALRTHLGMMRSASLARAVIQDLRLDTVDEFHRSGGIKGRLISWLPWFGDDEKPPADSSGVPRQPLVARFLDRLLVDPVARSRLVEVSFEAGEPELAALVVNAIIDEYVARRIGERSGVAQRLALQVDSVRAKLAQSEAELLQYAEANDLPYLVEEDIATEVQVRLRDLQTRLADARSARYERESVYNMVLRGGRPDLTGDEVTADLTIQLAELRREYARLSQTFTDDYPEVAQLRGQISELETVVTEEQQRLRSRIESDYRVAVQRENMLLEAIAAEERAASALGPKSGAYHVLRQAVIADRALHAALQEQQREAEVSAAVGATHITVVDRAVPPLDPHHPVFGINLALAVMLGMVMGIGTAFVREYADDTVRTGEDVNDTAHLPILAMIPSHAEAGAARGAAANLGLGSGGQRHARRTSWPRIDGRGGNGSAHDQRLGRALAAEATPRSILISSCRVGEGKTTVSVNFALSLVGLGNRVLLVDADLRRPSIHRALGLPSGPGLADHLRRGVSWQDMVRRTEVDGLHVLPSGGATPDAGDLLASRRTAELLAVAKQRFDFVIVDAPALFISAYDARILAKHVDGLVVVVRSRETPRTLVNRIPQEVPNVIGVVVNDLQASTLPHYFREYFDPYGEQRSATKRSGAV